MCKGACQCLGVGDCVFGCGVCVGDYTCPSLRGVSAKDHILFSGGVFTVSHANVIS